MFSQPSFPFYSLLSPFHWTCLLFEIPDPDDLHRLKTFPVKTVGGERRYHYRAERQCDKFSDGRNMFLGETWQVCCYFQAENFILSVNKNLFRWM